MLTAYDITGEQYHHTREDVDTLHELARQLPRSGVIVNIGTCFGTSALAFVEERSDLHLFTIDINPCPTAVEHWKAARISPGQIVQIIGRSQEVGIWWPYPVDLAFIDGAHDHASVLQDMTQWRGNVKENGILAFHDYGTPSLPAVKQMVDEHMRGKHVVLYHGTIKAFRL